LVKGTISLPDLELAVHTFFTINLFKKGGGIHSTQTFRQVLPWASLLVSFHHFLNLILKSVGSDSVSVSVAKIM
jgi:hypothetical protein